MTPYAWQEQALPALRQAYAQRTGKGALVEAATGSGKTAGAHYWLNDLVLRRGKRILWVAKQEELVFQPRETCRRWWPHVTTGIVKANVNEPRAQAVYASIDTLTRTPARLDAILVGGDVDAVVIDEAHQSASAQYKRFIQRIDELRIFRLGLTATIERGDSKPLSDRWDLVFSYPILDALRDGCIVQPYVSVCKLPGLDLTRLAVERGDYVPAELERELMRAHVVQYTVAALTRTHRALALPFWDQERTIDPREGGALVHTVTVDQALATVVALREAGFRSEAVYGDMPKAKRRDVLEAFRAEQLDVLCSPAALAEGTDLPRTRVNVLARATRSRRLYVQITGRGVRTHAGKGYGLLIDLVGASKIHSLVGAPVLIDGIDCPEAEDGQHRYMETADGGGWCTNCGKTIKCYRNKGPHSFKDGRCKKCGAVQCPDGPALDHTWVPWGEGKKRCAHCTIEVKDNLFSLGNSRYQKEPVNWKLVAKSEEGETWAVDLGRLGSLFNVRHGQLWRPIWVSKNKVHPLTPGPVTAEISRLVTDDVARQAALKGGGYGTGARPSGPDYSKAKLVRVAQTRRVEEV